MAQETIQLPHKLTLDQRSDLTMSGVTEVVSFDDTAVVLKTQLGDLVVQGNNLKLQTLSLDGGQVAVSGHISALSYEEPKTGGFFRRFLP